MSWFRHPTIRICPNCGLEEQAGPYDHYPQYFVQLRSEFVAEGDCVKYRVPNQGSDFKTVRHGRYVQETE